MKDFPRNKINQFAVFRTKNPYKYDNILPIHIQTIKQNLSTSIAEKNICQPIQKNK